MLGGVYDQEDTRFIEKDLIDLAIKWNKLEPTNEVVKHKENYN